MGQLGVIVTGYADTIMVGNYNTDALASASFVNSIMAFVCSNDYHFILSV